MSTTEKGNEFELICKQIFDKNILPNLVSEKSECKSFWKKPYFHRDRENNVIIDISIEIWMPGADRYSFLILIECKDKGRNIEPADFDEFVNVAQNISGAVKMVFITRNGFSQSAKNIAKNRNIMLINIPTNDNYDILMYRTQRKKDSHLFEVKNDVLINSVLNKILKGIAIYVDSIAESKKIPYYTSILIENKVIQLLSEFNYSYEKSTYMYDFDKFVKFLCKSYGISIKKDLISKVDSSTRPIVSSCNPKSGLIRLNPTLLSNSNYRFFLAHELGHFFLHQNLSIDQLNYDLFDDSKINYKTGFHDLNNDRNILENQANKFAAFLVMPKYAFMFKCLFIKQELGYLPLDLPIVINNNSKSANLSTFYDVLNGLKNEFQSSHSIIRIRMKQLQLLNDLKS